MKLSNKQIHEISWLSIIGVFSLLRWAYFSLKPNVVYGVMMVALVYVYLYFLDKIMKKYPVKKRFEFIPRNLLSFLNLLALFIGLHIQNEIFDHMFHW